MNCSEHQAMHLPGSRTQLLALSFLLCQMPCEAMFKPVQGVEIQVLRPSSEDVSWTTDEQIDLVYLVRRSWDAPHGALVNIVINNIPVSSSPVVSFPMTVSFGAGTLGARTYTATLSLVDESDRPLGVQTTTTIRVVPPPVPSAEKIRFISPYHGQISFVNEKIKFRIAVSGIGGTSRNIQLSVDGQLVTETISSSDDLIEFEEDVKDWTLGIWMCRSNHGVFCPGVRTATVQIGELSSSVVFVLLALVDVVPFGCPTFASRSQISPVGTGDGQWEEAAACYSHAVAIAPLAKVLWEKAAQVERFSRSRIAAISAYKTVLRLGGRSFSASSALKHLKSPPGWLSSPPSHSSHAAQPYLSVVLTNRYDDSVLCQGPSVATCLARHRASMQVWLWLLRKYQLAAEIILVEYNPLDKYPSMAELLVPLLDMSECTTSVRIITVPNELHRTLPNPGNVEVFEWLAKNAGIRRARGEFVLITNGDCVFTDEMVGTLARRNLNHQILYSTLRRSFYTETVPVGLSVSPDAMVDFTQHRASNLAPSDMLGYFGPKALVWKFAACSPLGSDTSTLDQVPPDPEGNLTRLFNFAPGDFFLVAREKIHAFRGAPEVPQATGTDSAMLFTAAAHGLRQLLFPGPCTFLHQEHMTLNKYNAHTFDKLDEMHDKILKAGSLANIKPDGTREYHRWNDEKWGFGSLQLPEIELNPILE